MRVGIVLLDGPLGWWRIWCFWKQRLFLECEGGSCFARGLVGFAGVSEFPAMAFVPGTRGSSLLCSIADRGCGDFGVNGKSICSWNVRVGIVLLDCCLGWLEILCLLETAFVPGM